MKRLATSFEDSDRSWVVENANETQAPGDAPLERLRARVWLRDLLRGYRQVARDRGLDEVEWKPDWVGEIPFTLD